jgi:hypothetical protein
VIILACSGDFLIISYVINMHYFPLTILLLLSVDSLSLLGEVSLFHYFQSVAIFLVEFGTFCLSSVLTTRWDFNVHRCVHRESI